MTLTSLTGTFADSIVKLAVVSWDSFFCNWARAKGKKASTGDRESALGGSEGRQIRVVCSGV